MNVGAEIRESLRNARRDLQSEYHDHPSPARHLRSQAKIVDAHLCRLWHSFELPAQIALVAVGGYGRSELFPKSDIDLLILLPHPPEDALQQQIQTLIGTLWDLGLEIGHSVRTIDECLSAASDITVQTNLLESRLITGSRKLFTALRAQLDAGLDSQAFFQAKMREQEQRRTRYLDTDYNLEPNLKESPGGLRDLQTVMWIANACGFGKTWQELAENRLLTPEEARHAARHQRFLHDLRIRLHYLSGRHDDRLLFEYQTELADQLDILSSPQRRASEHLMQRYYRARRAVIQLNDVLLQNMKARIYPSVETQPLNADFIARDDKLEARDDSLFERHPSAILEAFLLLEQHPRLSGFSATTLRALWRARSAIDTRFRHDHRNQELFMALLRQPQGLTHALRRMNQLDILGRYLPVFGRIVGQMQHDLFHVYTVDEHIMMVVRNLRRFTLPQHAHEAPLCHRIIQDFAHPEVLYIAGLFHDIAKGRGGDHSTLGKQDAFKFCKQHRLDADDTELVIWLVEHHLVMSSTAQKQDLSDQDVIARFTRLTGDERHLDALYLLTVADIRGTSGKVWNAWKGKLLEDLYHATRRYLSKGKVEDQSIEVRRIAGDLLNREAIAAESYNAFWSLLDNDYFQRHEAHEVAWHTRQLAAHVYTPAPLVRTRVSVIGEGLQIMVYAQDRPHLFASICDFISHLNYNIVEAKVHTTQHGYALDSFVVMDANGSTVQYRDVMNYIEYELSRKLGSSDTLPTPHTGRVSRQLKHFPIAPQASIKQDQKGKTILSIIAGDRPGLLAKIAWFLAQHRIEIQSAKINTLGARAEDTFWISSEQLNDSQVAGELCRELRTQLT